MGLLRNACCCRASALGVLVLAWVVGATGCALSHRRADDGGSPRDAGRDAPPTCEAIRCPPECSVLTGLDGCPTGCGCPPPPPASCAEAECVLVYDLTACCGGCAIAVSAERAAAERCLVRAGDPFPDDCRPPTCSDDCPAIDCEAPAGAMLEEGECVATFECPPGEVQLFTECAPRCASHADCVIATDVLSCCGMACGAYPCALAASRPCWVGPGETGEGCPRPFDLCSGLGCAVFPCPDDPHAACGEDGRCILVEGPAVCPAGYEDRGARCFPIPRR